MIREGETGASKAQSRQGIDYVALFCTICCYLTWTHFHEKYHDAGYVQNLISEVIKGIHLEGTIWSK